jgi:ketosteroid isomerase-like protein
MVLVAALSGELAACTKAAEAPMHDAAADKLAIDAVRNREMSAMNSGVTDSMVTVYADDILLMPNHDAAVTGIAAVRAWYDTSFSHVTLTGRRTSSSAEVSGDLAVDHFTGELTVTFKAPGAKPMTEGMKGIHVYHRQADGSWKITKVIWNGDQRLDAPAK